MNAERRNDSFIIQHLLFIVLLRKPLFLPTFPRLSLNNSRLSRENRAFSPDFTDFPAAARVRERLEKRRFG
jgi:hypothetical protein